MATRNIVPRGDGEGSIGTSAKKWGGVFTEQINNMPVDSLGGLSVGFITALTQSTAPDGWLSCNGAEVSRATYPDLWDYIKNTSMVLTEADWQSKNTAGSPNIGWFSSGDGTSTFRLPRIVGSGELTEVKRFTTAGAGSFTAPITGIYRITLQGAGGGGAGSGDDGYGGKYTGGGGGQGGHGVFYEKLTAGTTYSYTIGAGGAGGAGQTKGSDGGDTSITLNSNAYVAGGGKAGNFYTNGGISAGGLGGTCTINNNVISRGAPGGNGMRNQSGYTLGGNGGGQGGGINSSGNFGAGGSGGLYDAANVAGAKGGDGYIEFAYNPVPQYWYVRAFGSASNQGTIDITALANALNAKLSISSVPLIAGYNGKQTFTSSGSFVAPVTGLYKITLQGAGGGGGGAWTHANHNGGGGGGGRGAHGTFYESLTAGQSYSFTIGAGGTGGTGGDGNNSTGSPGGTGGNSSITIGTNTYTANGGAGGGGHSMTGGAGTGGKFEINGDVISGYDAIDGTAGEIGSGYINGGCGGAGASFVSTEVNLAKAGGGGYGGVVRPSPTVFTNGGNGGDGYITFEWLDTSLL